MMKRIIPTIILIVAVVFLVSCSGNEKDKIIGYWCISSMDDDGYFKIEKQEENYKMIDADEELPVTIEESDKDEYLYDLKMTFVIDDNQVEAFYKTSEDNITMTLGGFGYESKRISEKEYKAYEERVKQEKIKQEKIEQEKIEQENLKNNIELQDEISSGILVEDNDYSYYGKGGAVYKKDKKTKEETLLFDTRLKDVDKVFLYENKLYYTDNGDNLRIYEYDLKTSKNEMIFDIPQGQYGTRRIDYLRIDNDKLYFLYKKGEYNGIPIVIELDLKTKKHTELLEIKDEKIHYNFFLIDLMYRDGKIYYSYSGLLNTYTSESFIAEFDIEKKAGKILYNTQNINIDKFEKNIEAKEIYFYSGYGDVLQKWIPGNEPTRVIEDPAKGHIFYKDKIIYKNVDDHDRYYEINLDGTGNVCLKDKYKDVEKYSEFIIYKNSIYGFDDGSDDTSEKDDNDIREKYVKLDDYFK